MSMSFFIILYIFIFILFLFTGIRVYKKYQNKSGYFFLLFCITAALWLLFYSMSFFTFQNVDIIYAISKISFLLSIYAIYSFLFFIIYFSIKKDKIFSQKICYIHIVFLLFSIIYLFTPYIIEGMYYNVEKQDYYEILGTHYIIHIIVSLLFIPLFLYFTYKTFKRESNLNKNRLIYILLGAFFLIFFTLIFQLILPMFGIWLFEKEVGIFFIPFLLLVGYSTHKYNFFSIKLKLGQLFIYSLSISFTISLVYLIKHKYDILSDDFSNFWGATGSFGIFDVVVGIILFTLVNNFFKKIFLGFSQSTYLYNFISRLQNEIPFLTNIYDLQAYLSLQIKEHLKINYVRIFLGEDIKKYSELVSYFKKNTGEGYFINDIVFLEENKNKFNLKNIKKEINQKVYIVFPLYNKKHEIIGLFILGKNSFQDNYFSEEIEVIKKFILFLEGHLKYIEIYKNIHDLSVNLDKKVDKQTIEYNTLINKQKEFINYVSHEVKSPIGSAIFQVDSILDDINDNSIDKKGIVSELYILNNVLLKIGDLVNKLFSVQQLDMNYKTLFKERVDMKSFLENEIELFSKMYKNIEFISNISLDIKYIMIDKVQFRQVLDNLLTNSVKHIPSHGGHICVSCNNRDNNLIIQIEDNGSGFSSLDIEKIFDKYSIGKGTSVGLGMGLYLCKTIVELHGGKIQASFGKKLGGAKIIIKIPII